MGSIRCRRTRRRSRSGDGARARGTLSARADLAAAHYFLNSTFVNVESLRKSAEPECVLHAADAERRGIAAGARVVVFNARGEFTAVARVGDQVREGVVWAPSIWWAKLAPDGTNANRHDVAARDGLWAAVRFCTTISSEVALAD